jgi:hypothetical protein
MMFIVIAIAAMVPIFIASLMIPLIAAKRSQEEKK